MSLSTRITLGAIQECTVAIAWGWDSSRRQPFLERRRVE
jgi:hypothetical protein